MITKFLSKVSVLALLFGTAPAFANEVHRYHEPGVGSVNSWLIEGEEGLVLIDGQRTVEAGKAVANLVSERDKPLLAILITHPHPDHIGGIPSILAEFPGTPVYATVPSRDEMLSDSLGMFGFAKRVNGDAFPDRLAAVTNTFVDGENLSFGDITLLTAELGPGESISMATFYDASTNSIFAGDVIDHDMHGFLLEKRTTEWLAQLDKLLQLEGVETMTSYPGHGDMGPMVDLTNEQIVWLHDMRELVTAEIQDGAFTDEEATRVIAEFEKRHPNQLPVAPIPGLQELNAKAVAEELLEASN